MARCIAFWSLAKIVLHVRSNELTASRPRTRPSSDPSIDFTKKCPYYSKMCDESIFARFRPAKKRVSLGSFVILSCYLLRDRLE